MVDQLPTMPTVLGPPGPPVLRPLPPPGIPFPPQAAAPPGSVNPVAPIQFAGESLRMQRAREAAPAPVVSGGPQAAIDAAPTVPVATPNAVVSYQQSVDAARRGTNWNVGVSGQLTPKDPLAGQIRFIDQNSPRVEGPPVASPNVIRGGIPSMGGGQGVMTNRDVNQAASLLAPPRSAAERANHKIMDIYDQRDQADLNLANAMASKDPDQIAHTTSQRNALNSAAMETKILTLKQMGLQGLGIFAGEQAIANQGR